MSACNKFLHTVLNLSQETAQISGIAVSHIPILNIYRISRIAWGDVGNVAIRAFSISVWRE